MSRTDGERPDRERDDRERPDRERDGWLLVRHLGALWGLRRSSLGNLSGATRASWIELADGETFEVDEILALAPELECRPLPLFTTLFIDVRLAGLAVWNHQPVALLAPGASLPDRPRHGDAERPNSELPPHDA